MPETARITFRRRLQTESLVRCSVCYRPCAKEAGLCHHCAKVLCADHQAQKADPYEFAARPAARALARLVPGQDGVESLPLLPSGQGIHCAAHAHDPGAAIRQAAKWILLALGVVVVGILWGRAWYVFVLMTVGAVGGLALSLVRRWPPAVGAGAGAFPMGSPLELVCDVRLHGDFELTADTIAGTAVDRPQVPFYIRNGSIQGFLTVTCLIQPEESTAAEMWAHGTGRPVDGVDWNLGCLMFDGWSRGRLTEKAKRPVVAPIPIVLKPEGRKPLERLLGTTVTLIDKRPYLQAGEVSAGEIGAGFPVTILPYLDPRSGSTLYILVAARVLTGGTSARARDEAGPATPEPITVGLQELSLHVPAGLHVERCSEEGRYDAGEPGERTRVYWNAVSLTRLHGDLFYAWLSVTFVEKMLARHREARRSGPSAGSGPSRARSRDGGREKPAGPADEGHSGPQAASASTAQATVLTGTYRLTANAVLDGPGMRWAAFYPTGHQRQSGLRTTTTVEGNLTFDLDAIGSQGETPRDGRLPAGGAPPYPMVPDERLLAALIGTLNEHGVYVASVRESAPTTSPKSAREKNRHWDILGRCYVGAANTYGIDVHLVVTGSETYTGTHSPSLGTSAVSFTVSAMAHNEQADQLVETTKEVLESAVRHCLESAAANGERRA
ncbi:MAG: hypothetical protein AMS14_02375 [Planctomycetes bacterium DG_20]|nr:MAG: hypothetical protein AMS14_02375 [Planctomycetes bacterium DG_20]